MNTFMFNKKSTDFTPLSNVFIDEYLPKARGEFIKVYILGLKYCLSGEPGINSQTLASTLHLLETDVLKAWNYWNDEGVINMTPVDNMGNYNITFVDLSKDEKPKSEEVHLLDALDNKNVKDMLHEIESLLGRPLSSREMSMYIGWQDNLNFSPELILLIIEYCVNKGKSDSRYIEKTAIGWHDSGIQNIEDAQAYIKKHEDKWIKIRKILNYMGIKDNDVMKPQEDILDKWLNVFGFDVQMIEKACDRCFERINKMDFKYTDAILTNWYKSGIKTPEDIATKDYKKKKYSKNVYNKNPKDTFTNYTQRNYDFDDIEKKLLGWDKRD